MACVFFKDEVIKDEERLRDCSSFKAIKEIKQLPNAICGPGLNSGLEKIFLAIQDISETFDNI